MKALNLYAGLGENRKEWQGVEVTAVEIEPEIARAYSDRFSMDKMIVGDAHQYLLEHYQEYDFIWASPPCPTHGQYRYNVGVRAKGYKAVYPDMRLYEEIILLKYHFQGRWVVENVVSYYDPLIEPQKVGRHFFWANFDIPDIKIESAGIRNKNKISEWEKYLSIYLDDYKIPNKRQVLRNCVNAELGRHVFAASINV